MSTRRFLLLTGLLLLVAVFATHGRSVLAGHGFVNYDDPDVVVENARIASLSFGNLLDLFTERTFHSWLPLYFLSLAVDRALFGLDPTGFHLVSVLLHALNALLVAAIGLVLSRDRRLALAAGLLFALAPGLTESVAWVSSRKDLVSFFLMGLSLLLALRSARPDGGLRMKPYVGALALLALALMAKGTVLVLPLLLLALALRARHVETFPPLRPWATVPFFAVAGGLTLVHFLVARAEGVIEGADEGVLALFVTDLGILARYVVTLVAVPFQTVAHHVEAGRLDAWTAAGAAVLVAVGLAIVKGWPRAPLLEIGVVWFLLALAPFNNVVPRTTTLIAERYLYVPAVGAAIAAAWALTRLPRGAFVPALTVLALALGIQTGVRTGVWRDSGTLWRDAVRKAPESYVAHQKLGRWLLTRGRDIEARASLEAALARAERPVHEVRTRSELAFVLLRQGHAAEALAHTEAALTRLADARTRSRDEVRAGLLVRRGNVHEALDRFDEALRDYREASRLAPEDPTGPYDHGTLLLARGRAAEAEKALLEAVRRAPDHGDALLQLAMARVTLGRTDDATATLDAAEAAGADRDATLVLRSTVLDLKGKGTDARRLLADAARDRPPGSRIHRALARHLLAEARRALGDGDTAVARARVRDTLVWAPESAEPHLVLSRVLRTAGDLPGALTEIDAARRRGGPTAEVARERAEILVLLGRAALREGRGNEASGRMAEALAEEIDLLDAGALVLDGRLLRLARRALVPPGSPERRELFLRGLIEVASDGRGRGGEKLEEAAGGASDALAAAALSAHGARLAASGRLEDAVASLRAACARESDAVDARLLLAEVLELGNDPAAARTEYEAALAAAPDSLDAQVGIALNLGREGHLVDALSRLNTLAQADPARVEVQRALGQLFWERHLSSPSPAMLESALKHLGSALALDSSSARTLQQLALVLAAANRAHEAIPLLKRAIVLRPDRKEARASLALLYVRAGRAHLEKRNLDQAESLARRATVLAADRVEPLLLRGDLRRARKDHEGARRDYEKALELDPEAEAPVDALATWHRDAGYRLLLGRRPEDRESAYESFRRAIALDPPNVEMGAVRRLLATEAERAGRRRGLMAVLRTGETKLREGRTDEAIRCANAALRLDGRSADAHFLLGRAHLRSGRRTEAEGAYREAIVCRPGFADAELNLGTLLLGSGREKEALALYRAYLLHVDPRAEGAADRIAQARALVKSLRKRLEGGGGEEER